MNDFQLREEVFKVDLLLFSLVYKREMLNDFFEYWSEPNKSGTKMKWELEKTWDLKRRLKRWFDNQNKWNNGSSKISKQQGQANAIAKLIETGKAEFAALRKEDTGA